MFDANAKKYAVLGHPVGHSLSPLIQNTLFKISDYNGVYTAFDVPPENLEEILIFLTKYFHGFNCTIPLKEKIIPYLDEISDRAEWCGSVNTVKVENGRLCGYSTDGLGMLGALKSAGISINKKKVLISGSGGVARVALFEALNENASVTIAARNSVKAEKLKSDAEREMGVSVNTCNIDGVKGEYDVLLQCTPVGMFPDMDKMPVSKEVINNVGAAFDTIYSPRDTMLIKTFKEQGKKAVGGIDMLILQAVAAQEIWRDEEIEEATVIRLKEELGL